MAIGVGDPPLPVVLTGVTETVTRLVSDSPGIGDGEHDFMSLAFGEIANEPSLFVVGTERVGSF